MFILQNYQVLVDAANILFPGQNFSSPQTVYGDFLTNGTAD
jgi:hypothetical protein